jgi:membrane-bound metal-dependent hydrolase YbcI (DUF457 family)
MRTAAFTDAAGFIAAITAVTVFIIGHRGFTADIMASMTVTLTGAAFIRANSSAIDMAS